ncbi:hypothetical protein J6590_106709, partial [Homalodisca vitripennis]
VSLQVVKNHAQKATGQVNINKNMVEVMTQINFGNLPEQNLTTADSTIKLTEDLTMRARQTPMIKPTLDTTGKQFLTKTYLVEPVEIQSSPSPDQINN